MWRSVKSVLGLMGFLVLLGAAACTLDEVTPPELAGPSELGTSIELRAIPDQLTADGFSSSVIEAVVRGPNGERTSGVTVLFDITTPGAGFLDLGNLAPLNSPRPVPGGEEARAVSAVSDGSGVARARYWAPFRTDQENDGLVTITARPAGTDFRAAVFRQVDIFLRAADRPSFPGGATCSILVEPQKPTYLVGEPIFFSATQIVGECAGQPIARYEWDLGDGSPPVVQRTTGHGYSAPGTYTVTLFTTETVTGCQTSCTVTVVVVSP